MKTMKFFAAAALVSAALSGCASPEHALPLPEGTPVPVVLSVQGGNAE